MSDNAPSLPTQSLKHLSIPASPPKQVWYGIASTIPVPVCHTCQPHTVDLPIPTLYPNTVMSLWPLSGCLICVSLYSFCQCSQEPMLLPMGSMCIICHWFFVLPMLFVLGHVAWHGQTWLIRSPHRTVHVQKTPYLKQCMKMQRVTSKKGVVYNKDIWVKYC